jgi:hypothetical protein
MMHQETIALPSLNPEKVRDDVFRIRQRSLANTASRALQIQRGLLHQTPAMAEALAKLEKRDGSAK